MSDRKCCVPNCDRGYKDCSLHLFPNPTRQFQRFWAWCSAIKGELLYLDTQSIYKNRRVCHIHFENKYLTRTKLLSVDAVPKLYIPNQTQNQETSVKQAEISDTRDNGDKLENGINLRINLNPPVTDETKCKGNNNYSLSTLIANYVASDADSDDNIEDGDGLRLEPVGTSQSALFSWNKKCEIVPEAHDDDVLCEEIKDSDDVIPYEDRSENIEQLRDTKIEDKSKKHEGFECNCCKNSIVGYRYSCVQCDDYDLCSRCEFRAFHAHHYMLRVPGPRPHEEVQSMLQAIRRHLFQSYVLLSPGDANKSTAFSEDSIKLEAKEEIEEVDPFESTSRPPSVSPPLGRVLDDTGQKELIKTIAETRTDLPSDVISGSTTSEYRDRLYIPPKKNLKKSDVCKTTDEYKIYLPSSITLRHNRHTYMSRKAKPKNFNQSGAASTAVKPSENALIKHPIAQEKNHDQHKNKTQVSDGQCKIESSSTHIAVKPLPTLFLHKLKHQDGNDSKAESAKDLSPSNLLSNSTFRVQQHFPHKRKNQQQIIENYGTEHNGAKIPKVILSRFPLVNKQKLVNSDPAAVHNAASVTSTGNIKSDDETGSMLVTPEYLGLTEDNLKRILNIDMQDLTAKQILIKVNKRQALQPWRTKSPSKGLSNR